MSSTHPPIPPLAVDAHGSGMRTFEHRDHVWRVWEVDGRLGLEVARLPLIWIDAPRALEELSDVELVELVRSELEPRNDGT